MDAAMYVDMFNTALNTLQIVALAYIAMLTKNGR